MHSFVRRRSRDLFDKARGEGVPLSQYDLAEVLLAFSGVCLSIMECELHMGPLPPADKAAMVHMWRLVGYHLGVHDAFNVCESVERVEACFDDLMVWNPERLLTCRESTHTLQAAASRGFGKHLGVGEAYWVAFLVALERGRLGLGDGAGGQPGYVRARPLAGLVEIVLRDFKRIGTSDAANAAARHTLLAMREGARRQPQLTHAIMAHVLPWAGLFHDQIVWRTHAVLATVRSMATRQYWQRVE